MVAFTGIDGWGQVTQTGAALLVDGTTVFTVAGGPIRITDLVSYVIVGGDAAAATLQWAADGTVGASTTFTAASASLASLAAGGIVYCNFTSLATAPVITQTAGVALAGPTTSTGGGIYVPAGIIKMTIGSGPTTTGTYKHFLRWIPLAPSVSVTAAF
jgi:heptaprenylglyceryl phosphate synthase